MSKVGIVGATGMVGEVFLSLLEERNFPVSELRLFASENSQGLYRTFRDRRVPIQTLNENCFKDLNIVFFSSGENISVEWAPQAERDGAWAIDNSSAFRMDPRSALIVPEVNWEHWEKLPSKIIANPNCTTIQLAVALKPLADKLGLKRVQVASYQAVSGAGKAAQLELLDQMKREVNGEDLRPPTALPEVIYSNCLPQIGSFDEEGLCTEERKVERETKKILGLPHLPVSAFTVRVPVLNAHSEAVWMQFLEETSAAAIREILASAPGIVVQDDGARGVYPTARMATGKDDVFVGRIARDTSWENSFRMWIVADNLRKGAALNGIQIAERLAQDLGW